MSNRRTILTMSLIMSVSTLYIHRINKVRYEHKSGHLANEWNAEAQTKKGDRKSLKKEMQDMLKECGYD